MATRRKWSTGKRLAFGFAQGAGNFLDAMMRNRLAEKQAERVAQRAEEGDIRTAGRMERMATQAAKVENQRKAAELLPKVASGEMTPDTFLASIGAMGMDGMFPSEFDTDYAGTGEVQQEAEANAGATAQALNQLRPPMRHKLELTVGKSIGEASMPEQLGEADIMGQILAADDRAMPDDSEPGMRIGGLRPEAYEYVDRAQVKAQALRDKPTERVTGTNPDGSPYVEMMSPYDLMQPVTTGLSATQQGENKGKEELATLGIAGPARVRQGAAEAGAEAGARTQAEIDAKIRNQQRLIDFDVAEATAKLGVLGAETDAKQYATQIADAREAAAKAGPVVSELQSMWLNAQPVLEQWAGLTGRPGLAAYEMAPASVKDQAINNYDGLVDAVRPLLARAFGQTGNPALLEQQWAKYVPTYSEALRPDDALRKLARLETLLLSQVRLAQLAKEKGAALSVADIEAVIAPRLEEAFQGLKQQAEGMRRLKGGGGRQMTVPPAGANQGGADLSGTTFIVTPTGIQLAPPKGQE